MIICGIPKNAEGLYYCPCCGFISENLDNFAIGMCWDCVYGKRGCISCQESVIIERARAAGKSFEE